MTRLGKEIKNRLQQDRHDTGERIMLYDRVIEQITGTRYENEALQRQATAVRRFHKLSAILRHIARSGV